MSKGERTGATNFFPHPNELLIWAYPENLAKIGLVVQNVVKAGEGGFEGTGGGGWGVKNFFPHPNKSFILAYPENMSNFNQILRLSPNH